MLHMKDFWQAWFAFVLVALSILTATAVAQTNEGAIAGNVLDPSGAMVPNAKISARHVNTGSTYETVSSSAGAYRFPNLRIGTYDERRR